MQDSETQRTRSPSAPRYLALGWVLAAGVLYLASVFFEPWLRSHILGLPARFTHDYLRRHGGAAMLGTILLRLPALCLILIACRRKANGLSRYILGESWGLAAVACVVTIIGSVMLNNLGAWPFAWRSPDDPARVFVAALLAGRQWGALTLWLLFAAIVAPFIEEVVFRFGVLQSVSMLSKSPALGVVASAALFGIGHLDVLPPTHRGLVQGLQATALGLVLGLVTVKRRGNVTLSLAVHAARNGLEALLLLGLLT